MYFIYTIIICLIIAIVCLISAFIKAKRNKISSKKMLGIATELSLFGLVVGCLGGIVVLLDLLMYSEAIGEPDPYIFATKLKTSMWSIIVGIASFGIVRIGVIFYKWMGEAKDQLELRN